MLKRTSLTLAFTVLAAGAALAQEADPAIDVNGDGFYSFPELNVIFSDVTDEVFTTADQTGDGLLDMAEVAAAQEVGLIPAT